MSPQPDRFAITPALSDKVGQLAGSSRVLQASAFNSRSPLSDETLWKRLGDAGFDEDSIKRRDKAALIAYIAKLEAEVCVIYTSSFHFLNFLARRFIYIFIVLYILIWPIGLYL